MRQIKIIQEKVGTGGAFFGAPRNVHMSTIINVRTIAQLAAAEVKGIPIDQAILDTHSVQYANNSIVQSGGRITGTRVTGGVREPASQRLTPEALVENGLSGEYLQKNGIGPNQQVLNGFDIDLTVVPANTTQSGGGATGGGTGGGAPGVPVPLPPQLEDNAP
jgi:hypothetical protein